MEFLYFDNHCGCRCLRGLSTRGPNVRASRGTDQRVCSPDPARRLPSILRGAIRGLHSAMCTEHRRRHGTSRPNGYHWRLRSCQWCAPELRVLFAWSLIVLFRAIIAIAGISRPAHLLRMPRYYASTGQQCWRWRWGLARCLCWRHRSGRVHSSSWCGRTELEAQERKINALRLKPSNNGSDCPAARCCWCCRWRKQQQNQRLRHQFVARCNCNAEGVHKTLK